MKLKILIIGVCLLLVGCQSNQQIIYSGKGTNWEVKVLTNHTKDSSGETEIQKITLKYININEKSEAGTINYILKGENFTFSEKGIYLDKSNVYNSKGTSSYSHQNIDENLLIEINWEKGKEKIRLKQRGEK